MTRADRQCIDDDGSGDHRGVHVDAWVQVPPGAPLSWEGPYTMPTSAPARRPVQVPGYLRVAGYGQTRVSLALHGGRADLQRLRDLCDRALAEPADEPPREEPAP